MSLNYAFIADQITRYAGQGARVLDYGCGEGQLIAAALERGHDIHGCDNYESGTVWAGWDRHAGSNDRIRRLSETGQIPFPDGTFDIVVANQVFEHIDDFERPLAEVYRVLKPGRMFINCFPTMETWWEGHLKAPFAHRFFSPFERWQRYLIAMHRIGFGRGRAGKTAQDWAHEVRDLPSACFYKRRGEIERSFRTWFEILPSVEADWIRHRLANSRSLSWVPTPQILDPILRFLCSRLASCVFVLRRKDQVKASHASVAGMKGLTTLDAHQQADAARQNRFARSCCCPLR